MKLKFSVPYVLLGMVLLGTSKTTANTDRQPEHFEFHSVPKNGLPEKLAYANIVRYDLAREKSLNQNYLIAKANSLCDIYVDNMISAQQRLGPLLGKKGYAAAVRRELPGAPVYRHCMWGQYTQLARALQECGDTLTIIPNGARTACCSFKNLMAQKYGGAEYKDCIHNGVMHESDSVYNAALEKYLLGKHITADSPDSVRNNAAAQFAKTNFSADCLESGAVLIVPRYRGARNKFHAIMYLGRGRVEQGRFVADEKGRHIYVGHNRETIGDLFNTYDSSNVFATDTRKIAFVEYSKEWAKIEQMTNEELAQYIADKDMRLEDLRQCSRAGLLRLARDKYFKCNTIPNLSEPAVLFAQNRDKVIGWGLENRLQNTI